MLCAIQYKSTKQSKWRDFSFVSVDDTKQIRDINQYMTKFGARETSISWANQCIYYKNDAGEYFKVSLSGE